MANERRKFKRFDVSLDVAFKISNGSDEYFTGVTMNVSRSGLCFESGMFGLALQELVDLKLKLPDTDRFISVSGDVAWKKQGEDKCWVGIAFREINKEAKSQILDYAYDRWVEQNRNLHSQ
jgi:c-di-GMP-binding flagellar brake protein YcgR